MSTAERSIPSRHVVSLVCIAMGCTLSQQPAYADKPESDHDKRPERVIVINDPAKTAFFATSSAVVPATGGSVGATTVGITLVPAGQRLVIETVSVNCDVQGGGAGPFYVKVQTSQTGFVAGGLNVPLQSQGNDGLGAAGLSYFAGSMAAKLYADHLQTGGSTDVEAIFYIPAHTGSTGCAFSLSGYLVDFP
jgi:hypothetical protein